MPENKIADSDDMPAVDMFGSGQWTVWAGYTPLNIQTGSVNRQFVKFNWHNTTVLDQYFFLCINVNFPVNL